MTDWYLTFCKPNQEHIAQQNLLRQGFDVYLPQVAQKQVLKSVNTRVKVLMEFMSQQHKVSLSVGQCRAMVQ